MVALLHNFSAPLKRTWLLKAASFKERKRPRGTVLTVRTYCHCGKFRISKISTDLRDSVQGSAHFHSSSQPRSDRAQALCQRRNLRLKSNLCKFNWRMFFDISLSTLLVVPGSRPSLTFFFRFCLVSTRNAIVSSLGYGSCWETEIDIQTPSVKTPVHWQHLS